MMGLPHVLNLKLCYESDAPQIHGGTDVIRVYRWTMALSKELDMVGKNHWSQEG